MRKSIRISSIGLGQAAEPAAEPVVKNFSTRFSLASFAKRVESLTDEQRLAISRTGFGSLLLVPHHKLNKVFLTEVMEAWNSELRVFEMVSGEIGFSLLDVALILGLPVMGRRVELSDDELFSELEVEYGASRAKRKVAMTSLEARLDSIGDVVSDDFVRSFLLFTIGTFLSSNDGKVDTRYLAFLGNLDGVSGFAWGAAVLEDLCQWLDKRKDNNAQYVGGCLIFLQIWSYEHFDMARPNLLNEDRTFPRVCRWDHSKSHPRQRGTSRFKDLHDDQIIWKLQPTSQELQIDIIKEAMELLGDSKVKRDGNYSASTSSNVSDEDEDEETHLSSSSKIYTEDGINFENQVVADTPTRLATYDEEYREQNINIGNLIVEETPSNSSTPVGLHIEEQFQFKKLMMEDSFTNLSISDSEEGGREDGLNTKNHIMEDTTTNLSIGDDEVGKEQELIAETLIVDDTPPKLNHTMEDTTTNLSIGDDEVGKEQELIAETLIVDDTPPKFSSDNVDLREKNIMLEEENAKLKLKISQQTEEIGVLRRENLSNTQLKKENDELKQELDILKNNLNGFANQIERHIKDYQTDAIE